MRPFKTIAQIIIVTSVVDCAPVGPVMPVAGLSGDLRPPPGATRYAGRWPFGTRAVIDWLHPWKRPGPRPSQDQPTSDIELQPSTPAGNDRPAGGDRPAGDDPFADDRRPASSLSGATLVGTPATHVTTPRPAMSKKDKKILYTSVIIATMGIVTFGIVEVIRAMFDLLPPSLALPSQYF
jgi:hypothetical protein